MSGTVNRTLHDDSDERPDESFDVRPGEGPGVRSDEGPGERSGEGPGERSDVRSGEGPGVRSGEGPGVRSGEGPGERLGERPDVRSGQSFGERPGERPGRHMAAEMAEQPDVLRRLLAEGASPIRTVAEQVAARRPRFVLFTARGTSDNAALYAKYLCEVRLGMPCGLTSMSTTTAYGARPDLRDCLVVTVSQSGGSPDLVASTRAAREGGAITLAVTNNAGSALAAVSEFHLDILAGPERALPATKTYTAELLALYLVVDGLRDSWGHPGPHAAGDLAAKALPDLAESVLARHAEVKALAARYRFAERMVLTSRGYGYPTAKEAALKLMETSYIPALSYSGADLLHGPLAMVDNISPVIAIVTDGKGGEALRPVLERLRDRGADLVVIGSHAEVDRAATGFALPTEGVAEELQPVLEILPLQMLAYEVTLARGQDPDAPRSLAKVTKTH